MLFHIIIEPNTQLLVKSMNYRLAVLGNQSSLGDWRDASINVLESDNCRDYFLEKNDVVFPMEYKYVMIDDSGEVRIWQDGLNYSVETPVVRRDDLPLFQNAYPKIAGVVVPLFSLRSSKDGGIGEFPDLINLIDIAKKAGWKMIQTLPINDTTLTKTKSDSYPYNPLSVKALHPLYVRLDEVEGMEEDDIDEYKKRSSKLNRLKKIDYDGVIDLKWEFLNRAYKNAGSKVLSSDEYKLFAVDNDDWLDSYAVYCYLRDKTGTSDFRKWKKYADYDANEVSKFAERHKTEIGLYKFIQFFADRQMSEVSAYARKNGVLLKGDIPIGVSSCSHDVWTQPDLFNTGMSAGAPPDYFSIKGQNWGFPTYNWNKMKYEDDYRWWKGRLKYMNRYFDAYRIDHILGFFRIWSVRTDEYWGLMGQFDKAMPFSVEELSEKGLALSYDEMTEPIIDYNDAVAQLGDSFKKISSEFFEEIGEGKLTFKTDVCTQKSIYARSKKNGLTSEETECLLMYRTQVLFIKDKDHSHLLHPRISKERNAVYNMLNEQNRNVYDQIYDDYFYRRNDDLWKAESMQKLPELLRASGMIVCGEDLGMIPDCVPDVMNELKILSLEIQTMPKQKWMEFDNLNNIPYYSVCTTSTHDMSPLRLWWSELYSQDYEKLKRYYKEVLDGEGVPPEKMDSRMAIQIVGKHMQSPAMIVIIPIQDYLATSDIMVKGINPKDERINVPDDAHNVWCYRVTQYIDEIESSEEWIESIRNMIVKSGRIV